MNADEARSLSSKKTSSRRVIVDQLYAHAIYRIKVAAHAGKANLENPLAGMRIQTMTDAEEADVYDRLKALGYQITPSTDGKPTVVSWE